MITGARRTEGEGGPPQPGDLLPLPVVVRWLATEMIGLAADLDRLQHDVSDLLIDADVSFGLMHRLQSLDAVTQALASLAQVATAIERVSQNPDNGISVDDIQALVSLGALRHRLLTGDGTFTPACDEMERGKVTLF